MNDSNPRIVLITRTSTQNQGNQALSIVWRDFLMSQYPNAKLALLERGPAFLKQFSVIALARAGNPVLAFDQLAYRLIAEMPRTPSGEYKRTEVLHDHRQKQKLRFAKLRGALKLRGRLAALGRGKSAYLDRLAAICTADFVVVNPAGEFHPTADDTALHYLLEVRCAQLMGCRTALVNLSFEVSDPTLVTLSEHVFENCDIVEFRDEESVEHLRERGGGTQPLVLPDAAMLIQIDRQEETGRRGLALAINALQVSAHGLSDQWASMIDRLAAQEPITLISNEWSSDYPFWQKYLKIDGVTCEGETLAAYDYGRRLSEFDVVVSSRLHSCVLGLVAGAAIIPVETGTFKLTGFFNMIGIEGDPIRTVGDGWQQEIIDRISAIRADRDARIRRQDEALDAAREQFREKMSEALRSIHLPSNAT